MTDRARAVPPICPDCHGFASAAVSSGGRDRHGHLRTLTVNCPACHGTGTVSRSVPAPVLVAVVSDRREVSR
ncbi:hypothetical protein BKI49_25220 [Streptomyces sp. Tue6028]|uniref:hypothetical protein n=1 Tax=Streptomyces sp. Tue6028 TaxID=2036037 RepID=UPI000BB3CBD7|nr:hypothetical protein [Streptomyces sp. Tue6028]PBC61296.1 hypothetical protein BKI49_25220 [Streptomyces sp. Tue6028]